MHRQVRGPHRARVRTRLRPRQPTSRLGEIDGKLGILIDGQASVTAITWRRTRFQAISVNGGISAG